jgi:hypothetical protein
MLVITDSAPGALAKCLASCFVRALQQMPALTLCDSFYMQLQQWNKHNAHASALAPKRDAHDKVWAQVAKLVLNEVPLKK